MANNNSFSLEEHDFINNAKKINLISSATVYAVVNTSAPGVSNSIVTVANFPPTFGGNVTLDAGSKTQIAGNITLSDSKGFIGLTTVVQSSSVRSIAGNVTLSDSKGFIGLTTVVQASSTRSIVGNVTLSDAKTNIGLVTLSGGTAWTDPKTYIGLVTITGSLSAAAGNITLDAGSKTQIVGNVSISSNIAWLDPKTYIGLVTITGSLAAASGNITLDAGSKTGIVGNVTLTDSKTYIGLVTATVGNTITVNAHALTAGAAYVGLVTIDVGTIKAWPNPNTFIGLVTVSNGLAWTDPKTYIGLTTSSLGLGTQFIGLVTASSLNAGTTKTLDWKPVALSTASISTLFTPTNANRVFVTNLVINSDATVRISIKSGVTYLTGNASIGIDLLPGGGWVETGSPDSPTYIGCASGALIVEKFDVTATKANVSGKIVYFQET